LFLSWRDERVSELHLVSFWIFFPIIKLQRSLFFNGGKLESLARDFHFSKKVGKYFLCKGIYFDSELNSILVLLSLRERILFFGMIKYNLDIVFE
jgi:hypothetical protein